MLDLTAHFLNRVYYAASNGGLICERWVGKNVEGRRSLVYCLKL